MAYQDVFILVAFLLVHQVDMAIDVTFWKRVDTVSNVGYNVKIVTITNALACIVVKNTWCEAIFVSPETCYCTMRNVETNSIQGIVYKRSSTETVSNKHKLPGFTNIMDHTSSIHSMTTTKIASLSTLTKSMTSLTNSFPTSQDYSTSGSDTQTKDTSLFSPMKSSPPTRSAKPPCAGLGCCQCGKVIERVMKYNNAKSALYLMKVTGGTSSCYILTRKRKRLVPTHLQIKRKVLSYQISTPLCMGVFFIEPGVILRGGCLNGKGIWTLKHEKKGINEPKLDTKLKIVLYLVKNVWKSIDFNGNNEKVIFKLRTSMISAAIDDQIHMLYWIHLVSMKLYKYDYVSRVGPIKISFSSQGDSTTNFDVARGLHTVAFCSDVSGSLITVNLKTKRKSKLPLDHECSCVCYTDYVWYMINIDRTWIQTYLIKSSGTIYYKGFNKVINYENGCSAG